MKKLILLFLSLTTLNTFGYCQNCDGSVIVPCADDRWHPCWRP